MKKETRIGILALAAFLIANQLHLPHLLLGMLIGVALCFIIIGGLPEKHYNTIKSFKQKIYPKSPKKDDSTSP